MKKRKTKDEFNFLVDFYWKNQDCKPKEIVKKAQDVDLLRNKFTNSAIYNYFLCFKRYLKDRYICKGVQKSLKEAFELKVENLKTTVKTQTETNQGLTMKINELASLENVNEVANSTGLAYNNSNIRIVNNR